HRQRMQDVAAVHLELRMRGVLHLQQQVATAATLPAQADHLSGTGALGYAHVELAAIDGDAQRIPVVRGFQRHRQPGAGIAVGCLPRLAEAGTRPTLAGALAREQALEEIAETAVGAGATAEHLLEVEATATAIVRRHVEFLARAVALR